MIIGNYFKGDNDGELKDLQHSVYSKNVSLLYSKPRRKYIDAVKLTGVQTELYKKIKEKRSFDHRVLQMPHDIIAANFRYKNPNSKQLKIRFNENEDNNREEYRKMEKLKKWNTFFNKEVEYFLRDTVLVNAILKAVGYENSEKGYKAEDKIIISLYYRYSEEFWEKCNFYKKFVLNIINQRNF